ncbi:hypothetical protein [Microbacterium sp.]|uniref:hypothetical protein n=1 Tax=Microbacterium sp. TaxID=51671 RepID=UPI0037CB1C20
MLIVLALIWGGSVGAALHFGLPRRQLRGAALGPMLGAAVGGAVWLLLTWMGLEETGWIWLASLTVPIIVTWLTLVVLDRIRVDHDERERARLGIV